MTPSARETPGGLPSAPAPFPHLRPLARVVFTTFLLTFIAARLLVILIKGRMIPDLFLHAGQTHVHHLNYGIFLLSAVSGILLFFQGRASNNSKSRVRRKAPFPHLCIFRLVTGPK